MSRFFKSLIMLCCTLFFLQPTTYARGYTNQSAMIAAIKPGIVNITVMKKAMPHDGTPQPAHTGKAMTVGSGVIVNAKQGIIITNAHVVSHQELMVVTLQDGRRFFAKMIGSDEQYDLAVLQIKAKHLTAVPFANPNSVRVGQHVFAIGSPFGLSETVTSGVISALNRNALPGATGFQNLIQTDAPINMGNSGGALINARGELIGINTAIISPNHGSIGIGFAIPSDLANAAAHQLAKFGHIKRGQLGVIIQKNTAELAEALHTPYRDGALIAQVMPDSAAAAAKLHSLDVVLSANGNRIHNANELKNILGVTAPGEKVHFVVQRKNQRLKLIATIKTPKQQQTQLPFWEGVTLETTTHLNAGSNKATRGLRVMQIQPHSQAALAGLFAGDIITGINQQPVTSIAKLAAVSNKNKKTVLVKVDRDNANVFLVIHNRSSAQS